MKRRRGHVVLWGGRPGVDWQFGSGHDMARQRMHGELLALRREMGRQLLAVCEAGAEALRIFTGAARP